MRAAVIPSMLLVLCLPIQSAAQFGSPNAPLPPEHWARAAWDDLRSLRAGHPSPGQGSRLDFARALRPVLFAAIRGGHLPAFVTSSDPRYASHPKLRRIYAAEELGQVSTVEAARMQSLVREFTPELASLGVDLRRMHRNLNALSNRGARLEALIQAAPVYRAIAPLGPEDLPR